MNTNLLEHYFAKAFSQLRTEISKDITETLSQKISNSLTSSPKEENLLRDKKSVNTWESLYPSFINLRKSIRTSLLTILVGQRGIK